MSFEIRHTDLNARIGRIFTKNGTLETPAFLPVININRPLIAPAELESEFGSRAIMTNAYLIRKRLFDNGDKDIHRILNYTGIVQTDSGGYQVLRYGSVSAKPEEIVAIQEALNVDIATVLDHPTGAKASRSRALQTVNETIRNCKRSLTLRTRDDILWVGPVQGGLHQDLVRLCSARISKMGFDILALGSPVELMENYQYHRLIEMGITAKHGASKSKPFHFFGAGHPMLLAMLVAIGYDLFDSASYALYAYDGRYMTAEGTLDLATLEYLPCSCHVCSKYTPKELGEIGYSQRVRLLAGHNLHSIQTEIKNIKEHIRKGELWELLEQRARAHPSLYCAFLAMSSRSKAIFADSRIVKMRGLFTFDQKSLLRPEIAFMSDRIHKRIRRSKKAIVLVPEGDRNLDQSIVRKAIVEARARGFRGGESLFVLHDVLGLVPFFLRNSYPFDKIVWGGPENLDLMGVGLTSAVCFLSGIKEVVAVGRKGSSKLKRFIELSKMSCRKLKILKIEC